MKFTRLPGKAGWWIKSFSDWLHWMLYCEKSWKRKMAAMDFCMWQASRLTPVVGDAAINSHGEEQAISAARLNPGR